MNPRHRDRVAFMRAVSGRFYRGMDVTIGRSNETIRLAKPHTFMAQERSIVEEAFLETSWVCMIPENFESATHCHRGVCSNWRHTSLCA